MKKVILFMGMLGLICGYPICAQTTQPATFEDLGLKAESYWHGTKDGDTYFKSGDFEFSHNYNAEWDSWNQFAYSNVTATDFSTDNYAEDQYRNVVGKGAENTATFAVVHDGGDYGTPRVKVASPVIMDYVYITNAAYAVNSMENGDDFAGEPFKQGDYMRLEIRGVASETEGGDVSKIDFYLADFRSENAADHYIVKEWKKVDLSSLGKVKMLTFRIVSSRANEYGNLLPAYFCLDELHAKTQTSTDNLMATELEANVILYPNPAKEYVNIQTDWQNYQVSIYNMAGQPIYTQSGLSGHAQISLSTLPSGNYIVKIFSKNASITRRFVRLP